MLFYILFLHQTTTVTMILPSTLRLFYILFLHQTTTECLTLVQLRSCFISCFYIKPQHANFALQVYCVVLYLVSTSNHNLVRVASHNTTVVLYLVSTSNHNLQELNPVIFQLFYILFLHQTTTCVVYMIDK